MMFADASSQPTADFADAYPAAEESEVPQQRVPCGARFLRRSQHRQNLVAQGLPIGDFPILSCWNIWHNGPLKQPVNIFKHPQTNPKHVRFHKIPYWFLPWKQHGCEHTGVHECVVFFVERFVHELATPRSNIPPCLAKAHKTSTSHKTKQKTGNQWQQKGM